MPKVSVLMTAYNRERFLAEAIRSVVDSSFRDFELLVVDDCSTDATVEVARQFAAEDDRVRVVENEENLGDYPNRNRAAALASGEYLKYVDSDDYIYPWGLEHLVAMMDRFPDCGYGLCSLDQDVARPYPFSLSPREAYLRHYFTTSLFYKAPLSSIIRRSAWAAVGGFSPERMVGDFDMWHRLSSRFSVVLMPNGIVWYRQHGAREFSDIGNDPHGYRLEYERVILRAFRSADCPLDAGEIRLALRRYVRINIRQLVKAVLCRRFVRARDIWAHLREMRDVA